MKRNLGTVIEPDLERQEIAELKAELLTFIRLRERLEAALE